MTLMAMILVTPAIEFYDDSDAIDGNVDGDTNDGLVSSAANDDNDGIDDIDAIDGNDVSDSCQ